MNDKLPDFTDLNDAFGKALLAHFFEPIPAGRTPDGGYHYMPSGVAQLAHALYSAHADRIKAEVWAKIDMDALAEKIAERVTAEIAAKPGYFGQVSPEMQTLTKLVMEKVASQLGQRVVDQMDLQLTSRSQMAATSAARRPVRDPNGGDGDE